MSIEELEALCVMAAMVKIGNKKVENYVDNKIVKKSSDESFNETKNLKSPSVQKKQ